jgi:hypothetical protein
MDASFELPCHHRHVARVVVDLARVSTNRSADGRESPSQERQSLRVAMTPSVPRRSDEIDEEADPVFPDRLVIPTGDQADEVARPDQVPDPEPGDQQDAAAERVRERGRVRNEEIRGVGTCSARLNFCLKARGDALVQQLTGVLLAGLQSPPSSGMLRVVPHALQ